MLGDLLEELVKLLAVDANELPLGVGAVTVEGTAVAAVVAAEVLIVSASLVVGVDVGGPHHPPTAAVLGATTISGQVALALPLALATAAALLLALLPVAVEEAAEHAVGLGPHVPVVAGIGVAVVVRLVVRGDAVAHAPEVVPGHAADPLVLRQLAVRVGLLGPADEALDLLGGEELGGALVGGEVAHVLGRPALPLGLGGAGVGAVTKTFLGLELRLFPEEVARRLPDAGVLLLGAQDGRRRDGIGRRHRSPDGVVGSRRGSASRSTRMSMSIVRARRILRWRCRRRRYRYGRRGRRGKCHRGHLDNSCLVHPSFLCFDRNLLLCYALSSKQVFNPMSTA
mmetsp:Transcript_14603/g.42014  ORF Transcript_14603/g.42014 Transcript_14603/m.42014 type:complete len:341 (-) Transcript_14603:231-1253(-)